METSSTETPATDAAPPLAGEPGPGRSEPLPAPTGRHGLVARARATVTRPGAPTHLLVGALLVAAAFWAAGAGPYVNLIGQSCAIFAIAAIGQSILVGGAGQVALSGGAFMAIGAFTAGILANYGVESFPVILLGSAAVGWIVGIVSGLPGLRFKGLYLLLSSMALQFIVTSLTRQYQGEYHPAGLVLPPLQIGSTDFSFGTNLYWLLIGIAVAIYLLTALVERTGVGLAWKALKESEVAAAMSGVDVVRWKLYAFAASGAVTAVAGCMFAYWVGRADYESYTLTLTITLVTMIFIGGVSSRLGAVIGAVIITVLPYILQNEVATWAFESGINFDWYLNNVSTVNAGLFSLLFLLVILFEPDGIEGLLRKAEARLRSLGRAVRGGRRAAR
ncbi:branched-chain amino acid ABC transporter permease [Nocardioides sp. TF02-7]|uniref:branched-chain amino acid ABC transporter permease n=1 Tax=Nocardioides sp. TF02-7 TaxID=2917724 RepID=UPI001F05B3C8|nr:branched-chain amino acid ABC transporter permease [Nocardioides sp. TF02-7]UMG91304.1 branched-chain amino acid ABC transporter permease [Nocardioides sp. TF02-7]